MQKYNIISKVCNKGLVAVIRAESSHDTKKIVEACLDGGIEAIEITFTVPGAQEVIKDLANCYPQDKIVLGAGTVLDAETARVAILNGAKYIVSPSLNVETAKLCNRYGIPYMPGAMTIKEVIEGMEAGADVIKIFPGELFGPQIIKSIKGPLPHVNLMPTGGVNVENVHEWIKAGCVAVGSGGSLTAGAKKGDYASITNIARKLIENIQKAREDIK